MICLIASLLFGEIQIINGVAYECKDGMCVPVEEQAPDADPAQDFSAMWSLPLEGEVEPAAPSRPGLAALKMGYMDAEEFLAFLENRGGEEADNGGGFAGKPVLLVILLAFLGGILMNLTPCVLPMIPINLMIIGKSFRRGLAYGLGIAVAYGAMGVAAAVGGMAFGQIQSSPWFNFAVAAVFIGLSLSLFGVFFIDFSKRRVKSSSAFLMGALSAVLAGACVAPVLISVLLWTADLFAKGETLALGLPLVFGLGMALPWPLLGAGMQVLPKPGAWMGKVNKCFGALVLCFAAYYIYLGVVGLKASAPGGEPVAAEGATEMTTANFSLPSSGPVLVDCWASWCKNCAAMEATTMRDARVKAALEGWTVIRLQSEDLAELKKLPGFENVRGLPAFAIFE